MMERYPRDASRRFGCLQVLGIVALAVLVTAVATIFLAKAYLLPPAFKPVVLTPAEEKALSEKLADLQRSGDDAGSKAGDSHRPEAGTGREETGKALAPEPYNERGLKREVAVTERELNGLLAKNTNLADKLAIDLSDDLISAKLRLPVDEDFPILGGQILRLRSGVELSFKEGKPVVILKGVTVMGVPVPNAWLGGIKNIDLVEAFETEAGFWKSFSDGIEDIRVEKGLLKIKLRE